MKVLFMTGKGGVGKSTLAAATAWQLSRKKRVLIVSLDPAHNLGDIFGVKFSEDKIPFSETLSLQEIDLPKTAKAYLAREIDVLSSTYKYLQTLNLDQYFSVLKYSPGLEEYALLTSIEQILREETAYDLIVFDTPPTGLTLRFLALPRVTVTWIERLKTIREQILEKRYTIHRIRGPLDSKETLLNYDPDEDEILKRLKGLDVDYKSLMGVLQGQETTFALVFNPDILSLRESQRLIEGLRDLNLPLRVLVNNKVSAENEEIAAVVEKSIRENAPDVPVTRVPLVHELFTGRGRALYDIPEDLASLFDRN